MKKFLTAAAIALLCYAPVVDAAFYENSDRYKMVGFNEEYNTYYDSQYVESVRYNPPYYILKGKLITVSFTSDNEIYISTYKIFYNMDTRTAKSQLVEDQIVTADGTVLEETDYEKLGKSKPTYEVLEYSPIYSMADRIFKKYYGQYFFN